MPPLCSFQADVPVFSIKVSTAFGNLINKATIPSPDRDYLFRTYIPVFSNLGHGLDEVLVHVTGEIV